jgi:hypothetical protein
VDYECELAVVIGKACKNVSKANALDYVLGYTCANDVSARDWQIKRGGSQWCRGKTFDTFAPLGPCLVLIDEWVAYARQLRQELPGGSFESQVTFAQALTEAAKQAPRTLLVASIPASKIEIGGERVYTVAEGDGPVNALDNALRKALLPFFPALERMRLADYKVRIIDGGAGTAAKTRVLITSTDGNDDWSTVGTSFNIIDASWRALVDGIEYFLLKHA